MRDLRDQNKFINDLGDLLRDEKLLLYSDSSILRANGPWLMAHDIEEKHSVPAAFLMPRNSEFSQILAYYILKQTESGLLTLDGRNRNYPARKDMKIGIHEPQPLGYENIMSVFIFLGGAMCVAVLITCVELIKI